MSPSEAYRDQEKKNQQAVLREAGVEQSEPRVYWAPASKYQLANFVLELKGERGNIIRPEGSLEFSRNVLVTDDSEKITFVENSKAFKKGVIIRCKDLAEAQMLTSRQKAMKTVTKIDCHDVTDLRKSG